MSAPKAPFTTRLANAMSVLRGTRGLENPDTWFLDAFELGDSTTVSQNSSMRVSAFNACVRVIAESVAALPIGVYKRTGRKVERDRDHPLDWILSEHPNEYQSSFEFRETLTAQTVVHGNAFGEFTRNRAGQVTDIWLFDPHVVSVTKDKLNGVSYSVQSVTRETIPIRNDRLLHVRGLTFDGICGVGVLTWAKSSLGLALNSDQYGTSFFENGVRPSGVVEKEGVLHPEAFKRFKDSLKEHAGSKNAAKIMILENGAKFSPISLTPDEAQFLESREFQVSEIARFFRMQPHIIGDLRHASFNNVEQMAVDFVVHTLRPWLIRIEQAINRSMLTMEERKQGYFVRFNVEGLLRGDSRARAEFYQIMVMNGIMTRNEARELEGRNPIEGGDEMLTPVNLMPTQSGDGQEEVDGE